MRTPAILLAAAILALSACDKEAGSLVNSTGTFGSATAQNTGIMTGTLSATVALNQRFAAEVPNTVNFAFNRSDLDPAAQAILRQQANWIRQFPEVRFRVFGFTDMVGSEGYNYALGKRRAEAVVAFLGTQGISRSRLEALVSFGKTRPLVNTPGPEVLNRRAVTEVSGFVKGSAPDMNGKYAEVVWREYIKSAERPHPQNQVIQTETSGSSSGQ